MWRDNTTVTAERGRREEEEEKAGVVVTLLQIIFGVAQRGKSESSRPGGVCVMPRPEGTAR